MPAEQTPTHDTTDSTEPDTTEQDSGATETGSAAAVPDGPAVPRRTVWQWYRTAELRLYVAAVALTAAALTLIMQLWSVDWSAPFYYTSDAIGSAAHFKTTLETGWYESQPRLGFPYGQHYHDYPFSDDLHPAMAKFLGLFTDNWVHSFNGYYLLTFLLCAATAVWFLRVCGLAPMTTVVMAVLFAVAPYHFIRNELHLFLSAYYMVPPALALVIKAARGQPLWGLRLGVGRISSILTGRSACTVLIVALLIWDGVYYAIFFGFLLAAAAVLAVARTRDWRRFRGAIMCGIVLAGFYAVALIPDLIYSLRYGSDSAAFERVPEDSLVYGLRFGQLVMPPPGHPFGPFADLRSWFDNRYPPAAEYPALGTMATIGFLLLLMFGLSAMVNSRRIARAPKPGGRGDTVAQLSAVTWVAFLLSTTGGLGLFASLAIVGIRGWNRMSIYLALLALAGLGLAIEVVLARIARRFAGRSGTRTQPGRWSPRAERAQRAIPAVVTAAVLVLGVVDQSLSGAVPSQDEAAAFHSDQTYFGGLEANLPPGSAIFQLPYRQFPESQLINGTTESDQLRPFMNSTTLRWSAGGIKGRPQTDWPELVTAESTRNMTRDLAVIGFAGILVDRFATDDRGRLLEEQLATYTGPVQSVSPDGRWAYLSLEQIGEQIRLTMTPAERAAEAAALTHAAG